jgi:hypothetical protein
VGRVRCPLERLVAQPAADLGLADTAVAQDDDLQVTQQHGVGAQVGEVCAQAGEAVVLVLLGQDLGRDLGETRAGTQDQHFQSGRSNQGLGQVGNGRFPAFEFAKCRECCQWGEVGDLGAQAGERLERREPGERGEVGDLGERAFEPLERREPGQRAEGGKIGAEAVQDTQMRETGKKQRERCEAVRYIRPEPSFLAP